MTSIEHDDDASLAGFVAGWDQRLGENVQLPVGFAVLVLTSFGETPVSSVRLAEVLGRPVSEVEALAQAPCGSNCASRRPWWRGGGRRRTPLCGPPFFAKRALYLASCHAQSREAAAVTPEHLLHGVLRDLEDPYSAPLGRRGRRHLAQLGWTIGPVNPASALLQAHDVDPIRLQTELDRMPS
jgi:hypothetical protein